ncbi:Protein of unknown function Smg [hydrothermal vent metagenome]|uniref:Protein Smg homolog n=1 Tax=hydrothermal vent metagenome TaxID=652676 RepID=A0A3B1AK10_9ZZZZ
MNENVVDILIYLFENCMDMEQTATPSQGELQAELAQVGFPDAMIKKAFQWLDELAWRQSSCQQNAQADHAIRIYAAHEIIRLDTECRGLLLFLEQHKILDQISRELVIDRALALDTAHISVDELRWIVLLVLMNQPGQESAFARMEDLIYNEDSQYLH